MGLDSVKDSLDVFFLIGVALLAIEGLMLIFWQLYLLKKQVRIVDIAWGLSFIVANAVFFILGNGYVWRKVLVLLIVSAWALRLVSHVMQKFKIAPGDDPRYAFVFQSYQSGLFSKIFNMNIRVLCLFLIQGLLVALLSLPFALMMNNSLFFFEPSEMLGLLVWMAGFMGETIADYQLQEFKNKNGEGVYQQGLWRYSRHPNYFFEWVVWVGYAIMAFSSPWGWVGIVSPLLILYLLLYVSGVPLAEAQALKSKGDEYRRYQTQTSVFIPWFRNFF
jgi:steroid 5-alpha reductase family enzyme